MRRSLEKARGPLASFLCAALFATTLACVSRRHEISSDPSNAQIPRPQSAGNQRINLNTASAGELEKLPGIGPTLARRIVEHRERYGSFRRAEHLIMVRGLSDRRFRALRDMIRVE